MFLCDSAEITKNSAVIAITNHCGFNELLVEGRSISHYLLRIILQSKRLVVETLILISDHFAPCFATKNQTSLVVLVYKTPRTDFDSKYVNNINKCAVLGCVHFRRWGPGA